MTPVKLYQILQNKLGNQNWWPKDNKYHIKNNSDPRFEIIIGAILTQNTAWSNVEKALNNLKKENILDIEKISNQKINIIKKTIKSSGFFNQKAVRLLNFAKYLRDNYNGDLDLFFNRDLQTIRAELLSLNGIGPETADSILLYAGEKPIFVVDAYTKRICKRIPFETNLDYNSIQDFFQKELSKNYSTNYLTKVYNELHALIVVLGKNYCRKKPACDKCPINSHCEKILF